MCLEFRHANANWSMLMKNNGDKYVLKNTFTHHLPEPSCNKLTYISYLGRSWVQRMPLIIHHHFYSTSIDNISKCIL